MKNLIKKKSLKIFICLFLALCFTTLSGFKNMQNDVSSVYLGGFSAGFSIKSRGADIVGLCDVITNYGIVSPSKDAGIVVGDRLMSVDGHEINCSNDIETALKDYKGDNAVLVVKRSGEQLIKEVVPSKDLNGVYRLGLFIRDNLNGIGTMTFIKKNGDFMALGHPIVEDNYGLSEIVSGEIYHCSIIGVNKGERGKAGELKGILIKDEKMGTITENLNQGLRGKMNANSGFEELKEVEIGKVKNGSAKVVTTINESGATEYDISIVKVDDLQKSSKNFIVKVTDERLLKNAGGIVQGMSGSPILQNGKIIGAVTHVFLNDPTRGYGITIDNMLNA